MKTRLLAVPFLLIGTAALAHVSRVVQGVHFKTEAIDFGQPPLRRAGGFDDGTGGWGAWRPGTKYRRGFWEEEDAREARRAADLKRLMRQGADAEGRGDLAGARAAYRTLQAGAQGDKAFLGGRLELLNTPGIAGTRGLTDYLRATHPLGKGPLPKDVGPLLKPWVGYTLARTPQQYAAVAAMYPASTRAAAALIMAARGEANVDRPTPAGLTRARSAAQTLLKRYPTSRFAWDAHGILARLDYLGGRYPQALAHYERQAKTATTPERKANAYQSIIVCARKTRDRAAIAHAALRWMTATDVRDPYVARNFLVKTMELFGGSDARAFHARLAKDPPSFVDYLEFRASLDTSAKDIMDLSWSAQEAVEGTSLAPHLDAIVAQVALARGDGNADQYARGALKGKGDDHALGTFVLATLDRRAGRFADARAGFAGLVREHPKSYLAGGARENLAIVCERLGDLAGAMDQYRALGYADDVAYLSDAKMTPAELSAYVEKHPKEDALRYTLAMRHLRRGDWDAAEAALKPLGDAQRRKLTVTDVYGAEQDGGLQDPLATVRALRKLDADLDAAKEPEAKAAALSAIGDYYYRHKCLLLYSPPAWHGSRNYDIAFSWNVAVATEADDDALRAHHDEHETYVHALTAYRRVLKEFPSAKVAPHAAYWASVAAKRLSNMAPYWRWRDRQEDLKAESIRSMALAAESSDPVIAKRAKKYGPVFAEEREEFRKAFADEKPPARRWNPNG